jgi:hypothetical protein
LFIAFVTHNTLLLPHDSSLAGIVKLVSARDAVKEDFGDRISIGIILPIKERLADDTTKRPGNERISLYANWTRRAIKDAELAISHLPDQIPTNKKPIIKPNYW